MRERRCSVSRTFVWSLWWAVTRNPEPEWWQLRQHDHLISESLQKVDGAHQTAQKSKPGIITVKMQIKASANLHLDYNLVSFLLPHLPDTPYKVEFNVGNEEQRYCPNLAVHCAHQPCQRLTTTLLNIRNHGNHCCSALLTWHWLTYLLSVLLFEVLLVNNNNNG